MCEAQARTRRLRSPATLREPTACSNPSATIAPARDPPSSAQPEPKIRESTDAHAVATDHRGHMSTTGLSRRGVALAVLCLAAFIINLDTTIVNIALPSLVRQLDASTLELQWVVDAYTLTFAALVLAAGSLGDRYGRKGALLTGLAVFGGASAVGGLVDSAGALIAVRAVMGVGAALIFPATLAIISNLYTE